jgi:hypothetical protein
VSHPNGLKEWMINGRLHRTKGPALIDEYGREEWHWRGMKRKGLVSLREASSYRWARIGISNQGARSARGPKRMVCK